jgi:hypothetical protein
MSSVDLHMSPGMRSTSVTCPAGRRNEARTPVIPSYGVIVGAASSLDLASLNALITQALAGDNRPPT